MKEENKERINAVEAKLFQGDVTMKKMDLRLLGAA